MIIDSLTNASKYFDLHPLFAKAFEYISKTDIQHIALDKYDIEPGLKAIYSSKKGMKPEESAAKFECHNKNIDIQLCINGNETIGWKPRESCTQPKGEYNDEKDVQFFSDAPDMHFQLRNGQFAIFFPEDVHAPMIGDDEIRKLVIKVKSKVMSNVKNATDAIIAQGMLPLYFNADETVSIEVLRALYRAGIKAVEYTNRGEAAFKNFKKLVDLRNSEMPGLLLGIGTIKNLKSAQEYIAAGADFLVSPGFVKEVAEYADSKGLLYAPGCMTPTEIIAAENAGVKFIKLFPGNMLGPEFLSGIKDIFPNLFVYAYRGVDTTKESIEGWFKAGVCAVGMGSKLVSKKLMEQKDYATIERTTKEVTEILNSVKSNLK